ncbi:MAG: cobalamin biosynthesis protein CobQ, partial [Defluviitaleaceae bacterium]|nr:cobalamin biosynthesis protein CobQ [Defluviitaleaceae bacterium]
MLDNFRRTVAVTGHCGSGKTNLSLNIALFLKKQGRKVTLADLDVVNPYFRSADFKELAAGKGIHLVAPAYAGSNLDVPSLTGELDARLGGENTVIIDVGGDDSGAYALGRYAPRIAGQPYDLIFVVNFFRSLT